MRLGYEIGAGIEQTDAGRLAPLRLWPPGDRRRGRHYQADDSDGGLDLRTEIDDGLTTVGLEYPFGAADDPHASPSTTSSPRSDGRTRTRAAEPA